MKFQARKIDLELELTTLDGETLTLNPKKLVTAEEAIKILKDWTDEEDKVETNIEKATLVAVELSRIYPKDKDWFLKNFDLITLSDILNFVAKAIGGIRKNEESSN